MSPSWSENTEALYVFKAVALPPCLNEILLAGLSNFLLGRWNNSKEQVEANLKGKRSGGEVRKSEKGVQLIYLSLSSS